MVILMYSFSKWFLLYRNKMDFYAKKKKKEKEEIN